MRSLSSIEITNFHQLSPFPCGRPARRFRPWGSLACPRSPKVKYWAWQTSIWCHLVLLGCLLSWRGRCCRASCPSPGSRAVRPWAAWRRSACSCDCSRSRAEWSHSTCSAATESRYIFSLISFRLEQPDFSPLRSQLERLRGFLTQLHSQSFPYWAPLGCTPESNACGEPSLLLSSFAWPTVSTSHSTTDPVGMCHYFLLLQLQCLHFDHLPLHRLSAQLDWSECREAAFASLWFWARIAGDEPIFYPSGVQWTAWLSCKEGEAFGLNRVSLWMFHTVVCW